MYQIKRSDRPNPEKFYTPDTAYAEAKKASKDCARVTVKREIGLNSTVRAIAIEGRLYEPKPCKSCSGKGQINVMKTYVKYDSSCVPCDGSGTVAGAECP